MAVVELKELSDFLKSPERGRIMGLDVGSKTVGVALSDKTFLIATPLSVLKREKFQPLLKSLTELIKENDAVALVVGLPIEMSGGEGAKCQSIRQFVENLLEFIDIPVVFWDERLSTAAVTRTLLEADVSREKRKKVVDKLAASYILQGVLDAMKNMERRTT